ILSPSAVTPPSPSASACTAHTTAMVIAPSHGPSRATASVPPSRCPCVPTVTGNIGASPTRKKAPASPATGRSRSRPSALARRTQTASPVAATTPPSAAASPLRKPSGMCMEGLGEGSGCREVQRGDVTDHERDRRRQRRGQLPERAPLDPLRVAARGADGGDRRLGREAAIDQLHGDPAYPP